MKRFILFFIFAVSSGLSFADAAAEMSYQDKIKAMEAGLEAISDPAAKLFFTAGIQRAKGQPEQALRTLSRLIVEHAHDENWVTRSELICAELYLEMGMPDAAEVTARQVQFMNEGTETAETARLFREKIKQVKEQSEVSE